MKNRVVDFSVLFSISIVVFLFLKRFIYPDVAFDTLNYHYALGWKGVKASYFTFPFVNGEFFPLGMHSFNPVVDAFAVMLSTVLGYRLGSFLSLLSLVGAIYIAGSLAKKYCEKISLWLYPFVIAFFIVNEALFQVATYFTDNVYTFFVLFSIACLLKLNELSSKRHSLWLSFAIGFSFSLLAAKLTNFIYVVPLSLVFFYVVFKKEFSLRFRLVLSLVALIPISLIVFSNLFFVYIASGNPIFPYYNSIFSSLYYPEQSWPFNFGPKNLQQRLFYPFYVINDPYLLGEVKDFFPDLKLIWLFLVFSVLLATLKLKAFVFSFEDKALFFVSGFAFLLWQFLFGYTRYAIALEFFLGLSVLVIFVRFLEVEKSSFASLFSLLLGLFFLYSSSTIIFFNYKYDIAWRPTPSIASWVDAVTSNDLFLNHSPVTTEMKAKLQNVDFVLQCVNPSSGYIPTLLPLRDKLVLNFDKGSNGAMTFDIDYIKERNRQFMREHKVKLGTVQFVLLFNDDNSGWQSRKQCLKAIKEATIAGENIQLNEEFAIDNFVGDKSKKIGLIFGNYYIH